MDNNWRTATGYVCIMLCVVAWLGLLAWITIPSEFTFKIEMNNNTKEAIQSINYSEINKINEDCKFDAKYWYNDGNGITSENVNKTKLIKQIQCFQTEIIEEENIGFVLSEDSE